MPDLTRRELLSAAALALAASALPASQSTAKHKPAAITSGTVSLGPASDYPAGSVSTRYLDTYGIAIVNDSGTPVALRPICTNPADPVKGGPVTWKPETHQFE